MIENLVYPSHSHMNRNKQEYMKGLKINLLRIQIQRSSWQQVLNMKISISFLFDKISVPEWLMEHVKQVKFHYQLNMLHSYITYLA